MTLRGATVLLAGISMLALAGCGEEEDTVSQAELPAIEENEAPPAEEETTGDAVDQLREGAGDILEGTRQLSEQARERAEQALEDAGPMLDRAGEIAQEIGASLDEIVQQAMRDFETGVDLLEQRIDEATGEREPVTGDPDAVLAPLDQLRADTRAAARAGPAGVGPDYVGVWAADPASCAQIDQEAVEIFAVITTTTIRRYEAQCNFEPTEMSEGTATLNAECIAEGNVEDREISVEMPTPDTLRLGRPGSNIATDLVRCHLPE